LRDAAVLRRAGADEVAAGEAEVGVALAEAVMVGDKMSATEAASYREVVRARLYQASEAAQTTPESECVRRRRPDFIELRADRKFTSQS
jgi:hypothetical protein